MNELRAALTTIHSDSSWWRKVAVGGALMLTLIGYPWADGFLMQSVENSKRGYPSPLPPWGDWSTRYLIGLLGALVDMTFFILPLLIASMLLFCVGGLVVSAASASPALPWLLTLGGSLVTIYLLVVFALGLSPIARLIYADEGKVEDALGSLPLRDATAPVSRLAYGRARLSSLPAYLPALALGTGVGLAARQEGGAALLLTLALLWLTFSALLYARLVVLQIYMNAERALRRSGVMRVALRPSEEAQRRGR